MLCTRNAHEMHTTKGSITIQNKPAPFTGADYYIHSFCLPVSLGFSSAVHQNMKLANVFVYMPMSDTIAYFLRLFSSSAFAGSLATYFLNFFNTYGMCSLGITFVSSEFRDCLLAVLRRVLTNSEG